MLKEIRGLPLARNLDGKEMVVLTREQRDWTVSEIERLRKEKEWLLNEWGKEKYQAYRWHSPDGYKEQIIKEMQQARKEGE